MSFQGERLAEVRSWLNEVAILAITVAAGFALNAGILWVSGRYGQPTYSIARMFGILVAALIPINALYFLKLPNRALIIWSCVIAVAVLLQARNRAVSIHVFMSGFERAILVAANENTWEGLLPMLTSPEGKLPPKIRSEQLPTFVHNVYSRRSPWCFSDGGDLNDGTVVVFWREIRLCVGVRVGSRPTEASQYIFDKQLSPRLYLVAFRES